VQLPSTLTTEELPSVAAFFNLEAGSLFSAYNLISPKSGNNAISYQVVSRSSGFVQFLMTMPESALSGFIDTMVAVSELSIAMQRQAKYFAAQNRPVDLKEKEEAERLLERFEEEVCFVYDQYISRGIEEKEAISKTRSDVKPRYVFVTYETVKDTLRKSGRFRKQRIRKAR
jgi:hypothetical protein